jgi:hypothetical protein
MHLSLWERRPLKATAVRVAGLDDVEAKTLNISSCFALLALR